MAQRVDSEAQTYDETEKRLTEWGKTCRSNAEALGVPTLSSIAATIAHVRRQDRLARGVRKKKLRKARKAWKHGDPPIDAKDVAEELGYVEPELTARGTETRPKQRLSSLRLSSDVLSVDYVISQLPAWAKKIIFRTYMYGQPDRMAADELCMPQGEYARRRRAAVWQVAARLEQRYASGKSPQGVPPVRYSTAPPRPDTSRGARET